MYIDTNTCLSNQDLPHTRSINTTPKVQFVGILHLQNCFFANPSIADTIIFKSSKVEEYDITCIVLKVTAPFGSWMGPLFLQHSWSFSICSDLCHCCTYCFWYYYECDVGNRTGLSLGEGFSFVFHLVVTTNAGIVSGAGNFSDCSAVSNKGFQCVTVVVRYCFWG